MDEAGDVRSSERLSTVAEQTLNLGVEYPADVPLNGASVIAKQALTMNDRVQVSATSATNRLGLTVGNDAKVGHLRSARAVFLKDRAKVTGDVIAGTTVTKGNGVTISGATTQNVPPTLSTLSWSAKSPAASQGPVLVENDARVSLPPNTYGNLTIRARGKLTLETGVYVFQNVLIEPQAELRIHAPYGPVQLFAKGTFNHRGSIVSTDGLGTPELIVGYLGTTPALVEAPFVGALIAPNADVRFQAAQPTGHQAFIFGKSITLDADTKIGPYLVDWVRIGGPTQYTPPPEDTPVVAFPANPVDIRVDITAGAGDEGGSGGTGNTGGDSGSSGGGVGTGADGSGGGSSPPTATPVTVTKTVSPAVSFDFPPTYPVAGGVLANGTVELTFQNGSAVPVTCIYEGDSPSALPVTQLDANLGRTMRFVSCSDGLGVETRRTATTFSLTVNPAPGYPVSIEPPIIRHGGCGEIWEEMTPAVTYERATSFDWSNRTKVAERDSDNRPTLYPAWIYIRDDKDLFALRKLRIHRLKRPLFPEEFTKYDDRCGTFRESGDGTGVFVNALIPGAVYNKLIDAFTSTQIDGNREVFRAVILKDVPADLRTPQNSLKLKALADAGFRYLSYEADPFGPVIEEDAAVVEFLADVVTWISEATQDFASAIGQAIAELDKVIRGKYPVTFHMRSPNPEPDFQVERRIDPATGADTIIPINDIVPTIRGWGPFAGYPLGANGMQVTVLQWTAMLPNETVARTDMAGVARMDIIRGGDLRPISLPLPTGFGNGVCIEFTSEGAKIVDFIGDSSSCDFRALRPESGVSVSGHWLIQEQLRFSKPSSEVILNVDSARLNNLVQLDDTYQYSKSVIGFTPNRVKVVSGAWADTLTSARKGRAFAPCMTFPNTVKEGIVSAVAAGSAAGAAVAAIIGIIGGPIGAAAIGSGLVLGVIGNILVDHDIVLPENDGVRLSRKVATHEYGHFLFCSMLYERNNDAISEVIWSTINEPSANNPVRFVNEAFADFIAGQVAGGADYKWIQQGSTVVSGMVPGVTSKMYCRDWRAGDRPGPLCFDANLDGRDMVPSSSEPGLENIGRVATLVHDVFDGNPAFTRTGLVPGNADAWDYITTPYTLFTPFTLSIPTYASTDEDLERVSLPGSAVREFVGKLADGLREFTPPDAGGTGAVIDDVKLYRALSDTMKDHSLNWCERCRVLALHDYKQGNAPHLKGMFESCAANYAYELSGPPPAPPAQLSAECTACPTDTYANDDGECVNTCPADVVVDGSELLISWNEYSTQHSDLESDPCPDTFILRITNFSSVVSDGAVSTTLGPNVPSEASCTREFSLERSTTFAGAVSTEAISALVGYKGCDEDLCFNECTDNMPTFSTLPSSADEVELRTPVFPRPRVVGSVMWPVCPRREIRASPVASRTAERATAESSDSNIS